jgi:hypothetical protein
MEWLSSNWIWLALGVGAIALFAFGRAGCGMGHGSHDHNRQAEEDGRNDRRRETTASPFSTPTAKLDPDNRVPSSAGQAHLVPSVNESAPATLEHGGHDSKAGQAGNRRHHHGC